MRRSRQSWPFFLQKKINSLDFEHLRAIVLVPFDDNYLSGDLILDEISLEGILHCPNCGFCKIGQFPAPLDAEGQRGEDEDKVAEVAFLFSLAFGLGKDQAVLTGPVFWKLRFNKTLVR